MMNSGGEGTEPQCQLSPSRKKQRRRVGECRECGFCAMSDIELREHACSEESRSGAEFWLKDDNTTSSRETPTSTVDNEHNDQHEHQDVNITRSSSTNRHKITTCDRCGSVTRNDHLDRHQKSIRCRIRCEICGVNVQSNLFSEHNSEHLMDLNLQFHHADSIESTTSPLEESVEDESEYGDVYKNFGKYIGTKVKLGRLMDRYNFQVSSFSPSELVHLFKKVFRAQKNAFKVNLSMGLILQHKTSGEYRFNWSSQNNQLLFLKPSLIRNSTDKNAFIRSLKSISLISKVQRPNTEWVFVKVTNVEFFIYKLPGIAIGSSVELPPHLLNNKGLNALTKDKRGKLYADKKCFFRCLALLLNTPLNGLERATNRLLKKYCTEASITNFDGVFLEQLEDISRIFNIAINVYTQKENRDTDLIFRSTLDSEKVLNLHLHEDHFSFVKDLNLYSNSYRCKKCDKIWSHSGNFHRHIKNCEGGVKEYYGSGVFTIKPTIFDELESIGIQVPKENRKFPYLAAFDIECMIKNTGRESSEKIEYSAEHELVSISVCSNVKGFKKPQCFVLEKEGEQKKLVKDMLDYLLEISETSTMILKEKFADVLEQLENSPLQDKFEAYLSQLPVLSFNGARYDLKVLRSELAPLLTQLDSVKFVIKKGTGYMVIATEELKFLDATYYIAPGFNYDSFIKAYGAASTAKSFFPYEFLDCLSKLDSKEFPCYSAFYSSLKNANMLEPSVGQQKITDEEVLWINRSPTKSEPITKSETQTIGQKRYDNLKTIFDERDWSIRDYLVYYNNIDVEPFIRALENMSIYYTDRNVDLFKDAVSAPGIAERIAFQTLEEAETFFLFNKKNKDLVKLFRDNLVGGPAIIFDRFQETGKTKIRHDPDGPYCARILGYDANALYLKCMAEACPCGMYLRRQAINGFTKEYPSNQSYGATHWLSSIEDKENIHIQHARNGSEYQVGSKKIRVDGFCKTTNTVYQYHGCFYHGCNNCFSDTKYDRKTPAKSWKSFDERLNATKNIESYIREQGHELVTIWECSWRELCSKQKPANKYHYPGEEKFRLTETDIISMIKKGSLFGAVEVDIHVPDHLKAKFSEMTPIFKNVEVTVENIGSFMNSYLNESGKTFSPTKYLIGSMFGQKILLITPLLLWYLEHGLEVTKIYQIIQFRPIKCFERFANQVSDDRRAGDADSSKTMIAETSKLLGNSVYGHSIMDKARFTNVTFCDQEKASKMVNDPFFHSLDEFSDETFEVTRLKKSVKHDLPLQLGFFVYQQAKLKMLEFYFDVVDRFIERQNFCLLEMDTDSLYLALSVKTLDEVIKPDLWEEWLEAKKTWFPRTDTPENRAYDKRTPGLFKLEWQGDGFVGLNAKTYFCFDNTDQKMDKYSSKGISKAFELSKEDYLEVLRTKTTGDQENKGFVYKNSKMYSYILRKQGLTYVYCKRKLQADGMSTTYLDV
ncbi:uncharacterized protein LOC134824307 isoform X1 [Bolinopsis microptera]